jgi:outer membrane immunogenic protein
MNLKALLSGTAISTVAIASAFAQTPRAPFAPPAAQPFTWTGFYIGGHVGQLTHNSSVADASDWFTAFAGTAGAVYDFGKTATAYGVQGGFNWQWSWVVLGIEGDLTSAPASRGGAFAVVGTHTTSAFSQLATLRGRAGIAIDRLWVYGTGGWAEAHLINRVDDPGNPFAAARYTRPTGVTFGAGAEYAFTNNWTVRLEYLRANFHDEMVMGVGPGAAYQFQFKDSVDLVRGGINYKF